MTTQEHRLSQAPHSRHTELTTRLDRHRAYKVALTDLALAHVNAGAFADVRVLQRTEAERYELAQTVAHFCASDLIWRGHTNALPMSEVAAVLPEFASKTRRAA